MVLGNPGTQRHQYTCARMFMAALFVIAQNWQNLVNLLVLIIVLWLYKMLILGELGKGHIGILYTLFATIW